MDKIGIVGCGDIAFCTYLPVVRELGDEAELVAMKTIISRRKK
jgi:predicted dehydrogenase